MANQNILSAEIQSLRLRPLSSAEIISKSVCEITESKVNIENLMGTLYDPRMGVMDKGDRCRTCRETGNSCPGHYGHINLAEPMIHPLLDDRTVDFLNCICFSCHKVLVDAITMKLAGIGKVGGEIQFRKILDYISKENRMCCHCKTEHPKCKITEGIIYKSILNKNSKRTEILPMSTTEIINIFDNVSDDDIRILGYDPSIIHPSNFIISKLLVLPIRARPGTYLHGNYCDDELTMRYQSIITMNSVIAKAQADPTKVKPDRLENARKNIKFHVSTMFYNKGNATATNSTKPILGIVDRLLGKGGQIRSCACGKRGNNTARTPISGGAYLEHDVLAVPYFMSKILSVSERINVRNQKYLEDLITQGKIKAITPPDKSRRIMLEYDMRGTIACPGDKIKRGDKILEVQYRGQYKLQPGDYLEMSTGEVKGPEQISMPKHTYDLSGKMGWFVERNLMDDDMVVFNRQPTLHKAGMQGMRVKIQKPGTKNSPAIKTFSFNLALTPGLNADES